MKNMLQPMLPHKALRHNLFYYPALLLFLVFEFYSTALSAQQVQPCNRPQGNALYNAGQYPLASLSFFESPFEKSTDCAERYALARMRDGDFRRARDALRNRFDNSSLLLRMFAEAVEPS